MIINRSSKERGFVLAAILWAIAIMFVAVGIFHGYVARKLELGVSAKNSLQDRLDQYSTEQTLFYMMSVNRQTPIGFTFSKLAPEMLDEGSTSFIGSVGDEFYTDGSVEIGVGRSVFALQAERGLFSLNAPNHTQLRRFLARCGIESVQQEQLIDSLDDYIDSDGSVRANGAEMMDYQISGGEVIANDILRSPAEIFRIKAWKGLDQQKRTCIHPDVFGLSINSFINLNVMPLDLMLHAFGRLDQGSAEGEDSRHVNPFRNVDDFNVRIKSIDPLDSDEYGVAGLGNIRLKIWSQGGSQTRVISLQLTPFGIYGPWQVDYEYSLQSVENNKQPLVNRHPYFFGHTMAID